MVEDYFCDWKLETCNMPQASLVNSYSLLCTSCLGMNIGSIIRKFVNDMEIGGVAEQDSNRLQDDIDQLVKTFSSALADENESK